jgi:aspartokinase-like uncharacterized kinase
MTSIDMVVKIGGSLLRDPDAFDHVTDAIGTASREQHVLVVPGGGPFAGAVREVDRQFPLSDGAAHWMAVLAMDQYAHVLAERIPHGRLVVDRPQIDDALKEKKIPVLAPSQWLRWSDPLPHSWDVTSDSIAAWLGGHLGARRLVLVKPAGATGELVDAYFRRAAPPGLETVIVRADDHVRLATALSLRTAP